MDRKEFQSKVELAAEVIKSSLESFNLYIEVDQKRNEFIFIDRDSYDKIFKLYSEAELFIAELFIPIDRELYDNASIHKGVSVKINQINGR